MTGQRFGHFGGTISYYQQIVVKTANGCTSLYVCSGNLNAAFSFPRLTDTEWDLHWTSSFSAYAPAARYPIHFGRSGYTSNDQAANVSKNSALTFFQRPAL